MVTEKDKETILASIKKMMDSDIMANDYNLTTKRCIMRGMLTKCLGLGVKYPEVVQEYLDTLNCVVLDDEE